MKYFMWIMAVLISSGTAFGVWVMSIDEKPVVRPGQEEVYRQVQQLLDEQQKSLEHPGAARPVAVCEEPVYEFGDMDPFTEARHDFIIRNDGDGDLILRKGETTCTCTVSEIGIVKVPPGEQVPVTLAWRSGGSGKEFHQSAAIHTNDPNQPTIVLQLRGRIRVLIAPNIEQVRLTRIEPDGSGECEFLLGSEVWSEFQVVRSETTDQRVSVAVTSIDSALLRKGLKSAAKVRVTATPRGSSGSAHVRMYVRPPSDWLDEFHRGEAATTSLRLQSDDTVLVEVPVQFSEIKRLSLYGDPVENYPPHLRLGRVRMRDTGEKEWVLYARIRGNQPVEDVRCAVLGIDGLTADVELKKGNERAGQTAVIRLRFTEQVRPAIYDRFHAGLLQIETVGLEHEERLQLPIRLTVLADDA